MGADPSRAGSWHRPFQAAWIRRCFPGVLASDLQVALAFPAGGQVECDRGTGTASARQNPHPVGYVPNQPQAVAGPAWQPAL
jgi:hypothetical protein